MSIVRLEFDIPDLMKHRNVSKPPVLSRTGHCSGVYISNSRDILTASHCFEDCVFRSPSDVGQNHVGKTCSVRINGEPAVVQIKAMSRCPLVTAQDAKISKVLGRYIANVPSNCEKENDLAVVRPLSNLRKPFSCLPTQNHTFTGQTVFSVGYPGYSSRSGDRQKESDGKASYYARGRILDRGECVLRKRWDTTPELQMDGIKYPVGSVVPMPPEVLVAGQGKIQSSVDVIEGSSGSPLINSHGEIVGIASFIFMDAQGPLSQCEGASYFEPVGNLSDRLKSSGRVHASEFTPCK